MGKIKNAEKVKTFFSVIYNNKENCDEALNLIEKKLGSIDFKSKELIFTHTKFYQKEMGDNLKRVFITIKPLFEVEDLYKIKILSNEIEKKFLKKDNRNVNLDPGYITLAQIILFSTKNYYHRIYIKKGIYAEVTLYFHDNEFKAFNWTYPDYASLEQREVFKDLRDKYYGQLKEEKVV